MFGCPPYQSGECSVTLFLQGRGDVRLPSCAKGELEKKAMVMKKILGSLLALTCVFCLTALVLGQESAKQTKAANKEDKPAAKDTKSDKSKYDLDLFLRIRRDRKRKPVAMETSITRYEIKNDKDETVTVDLIGVVHIGEGDYFKKLNKQFEKYDSLLYELVAPEGTVVPKGGRDGGGLNPVAALQKGMQSVLGLEFQLDHIDYTAKNFVHADMTPKEFFESMEENDESFMKIAFRAIGQSMAMQASGQLTEYELMMAMFSSNREQKLRKLMAEQMQDMESGMVIFEGRDGSTIINRRNSKALRVMQEQIDSGKKKLAIFYGAGHLPDMDEQLQKKFGMQRAGQHWLTAWKLR